ncbi:MAG: TetR/AcrR family transcriptional regulator [Bacteroidetes bacterium]|nr:TetR/AcrR family transcriptional regulator [Bacteroidota bacterium]
MTKIELTTEENILEAAKKVFHKKGFDGARMQEIADEAGINKSLLHYYFRSKEKLFEAIFQDAFKQFLPKIGEALISNKSLFEIITLFVNAYIEMLIKNPYLPVFVVNEINRNPDKIIDIIKNSGVNPIKLESIILSEIEKGTIININPKHLIINILSMCVFPILTRPIITGFLFNNDTALVQEFIEERKSQVTSFVINSIKLK